MILTFIWLIRKGRNVRRGKLVGKYKDVLPIAKDMTAEAIHILGARGELVVCRILKIDPLAQWALHVDYTKIDDGVDLIIDGITVQVKSRIPSSGLDYALTRNRLKSDFKTDMGVLVWLDGRDATVVGAFTQDAWEHEAGKIDFGPWEQRWGFKGQLQSLDSVVQSLRDRDR